MIAVFALLDGYRHSCNTTSFIVLPNKKETEKLDHFLVLQTPKNPIQKMSDLHFRLLSFIFKTFQLIFYAPRFFLLGIMRFCIKFSPHTHFI